MKTQSIAKQVCSLIILALTPGAFAQGATQAPAMPRASASAVAASSMAASTSDDPIGEWIEKNADRLGLYVDKPVRPKVKPSTQAQMPARAGSPQVSNAAAIAPSASASAAQSSDPIQAFIIDKVIDMPAGSTTGEPFAKVPMTNATTSFVNQPVVEIPIPEIAIQKKTFTPPPEAAKSSSAAAQISAVMSDLDFSAKCSGFATAAGFGAWGKAIIQELADGNANSLLQGTDDLRRACPNYDFLTVPQKSHVWVNVFASMSFLESSCDPRKTAQGPNGTAAGLLQLHAGRENEAAPGCNKRDSKSPITSLRCAISIIETQVKRTSALFSRDTHFGVLRPQGDLVRTRTGLRRVVKARVVVGGLRELPDCQRK
ncbi:hypothetical protein BH10BDE1_BH10BDE1_26540 [soil metagenome]